jgi:predicted nucleic acid-binding protein
VRSTKFIDSVCAVAVEAVIYFRWRPFLKDPKDDLVLECALAGGAEKIITHNISHFKECESMNVVPVTPGEFLRNL